MRAVLIRGLSCVLLLTLGGLSGARGATNLVFSLAGAWKYQQGTNLDSVNWESPTYGDSAWPTGPGLLAYETCACLPEPIRTTLTVDAAKTTYYFRKHFIYSDGAPVSSLLFSNLLDDGAVFYLNGVEIQRIGMAAGTVTFSTLASRTVSEVTNYDVFSIAGDLLTNLVVGDNVLAVEVHQVSASSSDITFGCALGAVMPGQGGLTLDGANDYVTFGAAPSLGLTNFTLECWFKRQGAGATANTGTGGVDGLPLISKGRGENDNGVTNCNYFLGLNPASGVLVADFEDKNSGANHPITGNAAVASNVWQHAAVTYDQTSGAWALYLNGVPDATNVVTGSVLVRTPEGASIQHAAIGSALNTAGTAAGFFAGGLDEVRIWDYARTAQEITDNYAKQITNAPGLIGRWSLDDAAGTTATNSGSAGVAGSLVNGPVWGAGYAFGFSVSPSCIRGPYLQSGSHTNLVVRWRTDVPSNTRVRFGTNLADLSQIADVLAGVTDHEVNLTGLLPDTKYFYSVGTDAGPLAGGDTLTFFVTAPAPGTRKATRVWVIGDSGTGTANQINVRNAYETFTGSRHTDLWLMLGDNAYDAGNDTEYQSSVFNIYTNMLRKSVLWPTLGNHDTDQATAFNESYPYFNIFTLPKSGECGGIASGSEHYYSFNYGNIHFICLDSMTGRASSSGMAMWLTNDLANVTADWTIAFWHHPPYTKGSHDSDTEVELIEMRQTYLPLLEAAGVDLVLTGHSHVYERSFLLNGHYGFSTNLTGAMKLDAGSGRMNGSGAYKKPDGGPSSHQGAVYAVVGCSGQNSTSTSGLNHPAMYVSLNNLGSMVLDIVSNRLDAKFIRENGTTNDFFTIVKLNYAPVASNLNFTVNADASTNLFLAASDINHNPVTFVTNTLPARGLISNFNPSNGALTYTPAHGFSGSGSFNYFASDGQTNSSLASVTINVLAPADANSNGIPDYWESKFGVTDPSADTDGDGANNLQEYAANTNPTNAASALRIVSASRDVNGHLSFTWASIGGTRYRVQYNDSDAGGFNGLFTDIVRHVTLEMDPANVGSASTQNFTDDLTLTGGAPANDARYYRVQVVK